MKVSTKSADGVSFTADGSYKAGDKSGKGSISASYKKCKAVSLDKIAVNSKGQVDVEATMNDVAEGLNVTVKSSDAFGAPTGDLDFKFANDSVAVESSVNVVGTPSISIGAMTAVDVSPLPIPMSFAFLITSLTLSHAFQHTLFYCTHTPHTNAQTHVPPFSPVVSHVFP